MAKEAELGQLLDCVRRGIERIIMVLGPQSSGKTTLLKQFKRLQERKKAVYWLDMFGHCIVEEILHEAEMKLQENKEIVIIIDEADKLEGVRDMIDSFQTIAKDKRATVVMATHCDSFREECVGEDAEVIYVGHLGEMQAKAFLCKILADTGGWWRWLFHSSVRDEEWSKIYGVCGGCPLLLITAAQALVENPASLDAQLAAMVSSTRSYVLNGMVGGRNQEWEAGEYRKLIELLMRSDRQDGAVEWSVVCEEVFQGNEHKLRAMQAINVIHVQYAPSAEGFAKFVMPLSPPHLEAMKESLVDVDSCL